MTIMIRQAVPTDAAAIARILRRSRQVAMPYLPDLHTPDEDLAYTRTQMLPQETVLVADMVTENEPQIVGFCAFSNDWINHLYLEPDHQGQGIGTRLLNHAKQQGQAYSLWCFQRNQAARRFYERQDFKVIQETDGADNEEREPDVLYRWTKPSD